MKAISVSGKYFLLRICSQTLMGRSLSPPLILLPSAFADVRCPDDVIAF